MDATPLFDELYHFLAAQGWQETGRFSILDGEYRRGAPYTLAVAWLFQASGEDSLAVGRLVSLVPGALLPVILFLWVRATAGWLAAGLATAFAVFWPQGIVESQFLRFYSSQVLFFFIGAVAVYQALAARVLGRLAWGAVAVMALGAAVELQVTTAIGALGILLCGAGLAVMSVPGSARRRWWLLAGLTGLAILGVAALWAMGIVEKVWHIYRWVPGWAEESRNYATFYHHILRHQYFGFWSFLPVAAIVAVRANARLAAFSISIFAMAFVAHSFAGMKALRYLSYAMPFFFILWGLALSVVLPALLGLMRAIGWPRPVIGGVAAVGLVFVLTVSGFFLNSVQLAMGEVPDDQREDWSHARALMGDWGAIPFRMTTQELQAVYSLGDYDILLERSRLSELSEKRDFEIDPRTGRPVIASQEALQDVLACKREGVIVASRARWEKYRIGAMLAAAVAQEGLEVESRQQGPVLIVRWYDPANAAPDCSGVPAR